MPANQPQQRERRSPMGNTPTCCLRPNGSPTLGPRCRQSQSQCESEGDEAVGPEAAAVEASPASPKPQNLSLGALVGRLSVGTLVGRLKNISDPQVPEEQYKKNNDEFPGRLNKSYRSCPTVFLYDGTINQPDLRAIIQSVTLAIYHNIKYRIGNRSCDIFEETTHPFRHEIITKDHFLHDPELEVIYRFVCALFHAEHLTAECAIVTLIYMEKLMIYIDIDICPTNWKRILLGAGLLAYEFWDRRALWGKAYCQLVNNIITAEDMNEIVRDFLRLIKFDISIPASVYARYYFDLRTLAHTNDLHGLFDPLGKERAQDPEERRYRHKTTEDIIVRSLSCPGHL